MSVRVLRWVWDHSRAEGVDRLVLLAIADCADHDGRNAYPGIDEIIRKTRLSRSCVYQSLSRLVALGELEREAPSAGRRRTVWRVVMQPSTTRTVQPSTTRTVEHPPTVHDTDGSTVHHVDGSAAPNRPRHGRQPSTTRTPTVHVVDGSAPDTSLFMNHHRTIREPSFGASAAVSAPTAVRTARASGGSPDGDRTPTLPTINPDPEPARPVTAQTLVAAYVTTYQAKTGHNPPSRVKGQLARILAELLRDGIPPDTVHAGLAEWMERDVHPSVLPSIVEAKARGGRSRASPPTRATRRSHEIRATVQAMASWAAQQQQQQEEDEHDPAGLGHDHRLPRRSLPAPAHPT